MIPGSIPSDGGKRIQDMPVEDILYKFSRPNQNGCLIWQLGTKAFGHGHINITLANGKKTSRNVHRWIYERIHGEIPANKVVCHSCDEPLCINPSHLFLGTQAENLKDMRDKNRHDARLTPAQKVAMQYLLRQRWSNKIIAKQFNVTRQTVYDWKRKWDI